MKNYTIEQFEAEAQAVLDMAEKKGLQSNFFFRSTFERYRTQISILDTLSKAIEEGGPTVIKEYVKGRENVCINPAITEYNKTATAANGTVKTLLDILKNVPADESVKSLADTMRELLADAE